MIVIVEANIFTSSFLPCDLGLGETISFTFNTCIRALSKCLIGGFQNPARRYCYRTTKLFKCPPGASTISAVNPEVSRIVILGFHNFYRTFRYFATDSRQLFRISNHVCFYLSI